MRQDTFDKLVIKFATRVEEYTNERLFDEYTELIQGDGEDGYLSDEGSIELEIMFRELRSRFIQCGFFAKDGKVEDY